MIVDFEFCKQLNAYADNELDPVAARKVEARLIASDYWRGELEAVMSLKTALSRADLSPPSPDELERHIRDKLR